MKNIEKCFIDMMMDLISGYSTLVEQKDIKWATIEEFLSMILSNEGVRYNTNTTFCDIEKYIETLRKVDRHWNYTDIAVENK